MMDAGSAIAARFKLHVRCDNCVRDVAQILEVPMADEAPTSIDDLLESAFLERQRFVCVHCDNPIGIIASIVKLREREVINA